MLDCDQGDGSRSQQTHVTGRSMLMSGVLRAQLDPDQLLLLREMFTPYDQMGEWPVWAYVDHRLDAEGIVAADVLASLPVVGEPGGGQMRYGLTWNPGNHWLPNDNMQLALTVAGMWHLEHQESASARLLVAFKDTVRFLVRRQRSITPSPSKVVEATVTSQEVAQWLAGAGSGGLLGLEKDEISRKVGQLVEHEPHLWRWFGRPDLESEQWVLTIPVSIRDFRDVTTVEEYIDKVEQLIAPPGPPPQPLSAAPLDIPYAVSFVDAVWESRTSFPLFARPDPASIARLTQPCDSEGTFNSLMSALADVLSQVAKPGTVKAPRTGALEDVRRYLDQELEPPAAARCSEAIGTLIKLRTIRHGIEHGDARAKAVAAYAELGLSFPVASWPQAWVQISAMACGALDALREEVHAGLGRPRIAAPASSRSGSSHS